MKPRNHPLLRRIAVSGMKFVFAGGGLSVRSGRDFALAAVVGVAVGLAAAGFEGLIDFCRDTFMDGVGRWRSALASGNLLSGDGWLAPRRWLMLLMPAAGAVAGALIIKWFSPFTHARGTDSAVYVYHRLKARFSWRVIPTKAAASAIVIGAGGSAGYEGPVTLIGAACGSTIARILGRDNVRTRRMLMAAGMAAGIGALFRAPLAGALFGAEIFYSSSDMEYEALLPSFTASAVSSTVFAVFFGWEPLFSLPPTAFSGGMLLLPYVGLAFVVAAGAKLYISFFRTVESVARRTVQPPWRKAAVGGLLTGALGFFFPDVLGNGYGMVKGAFALGETSCSLRLAAVFAALFFLKAAATSFTVGSGGSGGVFGPALVCGACLGAATGLVFRAVLPESAGVHPGAFALVGMAAFTAAAVRIPLTSIVMVAEISGNHALMLPTMWVCAIAFVLDSGWSLYRSQPHRREGSPVHASLAYAETRK